MHRISRFVSLEVSNCFNGYFDVRPAANETFHGGFHLVEQFFSFCDISEHFLFFLYNSVLRFLDSGKGRFSIKQIFVLPRSRLIVKTCDKFATNHAYIIAFVSVFCVLLCKVGTRNVETIGSIT